MICPRLLTPPARRAAPCCATLIATLLLAPLLALCGGRAALAAPTNSAASTDKPPTLVDFPSALPDKTQLRAAWLPAGKAGRPADKGARPAVVLLHGCGGAFDAQGKVYTRTQRYANLLNVEGWHVLVLDSYGPRGERSACKVRAGHRRITPLQRRRDALGALAWLATRKDVDAERLVLLGWSNGGAAVLAATNAQHAEVIAAPRKARAAVAFYPGCEADLRRSYASNTPLLLLLGEDDDWTPAQPCVDLAKTDPAQISVKLYAGAPHGFDRQVAIKQRRDATGASRTGDAAHVGGEPDAQRDSVKTVLEFLRKQLGS
jgi:dienelactone hydrolase